MNHLSLQVGTLLLLVIGATVSAQNGGAPKPGVGMSAPEFAVEKLLQAPANASSDLKSLNGRVVVLDFWATWCAPCIASMPHLNNLAEQFKDREVQIIAITDQTEDEIAPFLRRRKINAWIGLDADRGVFKSYGVDGIPYTVVIGKDGKIAATTDAKNLTVETLENALDGKQLAPVDKPAPVAEATTPNSVSSGSTPRFTLTIKPTETDSQNMSFYRGRFQVKGANLRSIISFLYGFSKTRIIEPPLLDEGRYEISSTMPDTNRSVYESVLKDAIEATFKITTKRETREMEVYVLSAPDQNALRLRPSSSKTGHSSDEPGVLAAAAVPLTVLAGGIESVLKLPVLDETGLKGNYDWTLVFDQKNPESLIEEVRRELGLELKRATRPAEVLVVTAKESDTKH